MLEAQAAAVKLAPVGLERLEVHEARRAPSAVPAVCRAAMLPSVDGLQAQRAPASRGRRVAARVVLHIAFPGRELLKASDVRAVADDLGWGILAEAVGLVGTAIAERLLLRKVGLVRTATAERLLLCKVVLVGPIRQQLLQKDVSPGGDPRCKVGCGI